MRVRHSVWFLLMAAVAGCGGSTSGDFGDGTADGGADDAAVGADANDGAEATTPDAAVPDATWDASDADADAASPADAPSEAATPDAGADASSDAFDSGSTADAAPVDATPDAPTDVASTDAGPDATDGASDAGADTSPPMCLAAGECPGFPSTWIDDATSVANCAGAEHQIDCCGARRVFGINHGVRTTFCPAETACRATYPASPGCTDATITTDTGETTTNIADVRVRCVGSSGSTCLCQTFVCTDSSCMANSGPIGGCGP